MTDDYKVMFRGMNSSAWGQELFRDLEAALAFRATKLAQGCVVGIYVHDRHGWVLVSDFISAG